MNKLKFKINNKIHEIDIPKDDNQTVSIPAYFIEKKIELVVSKEEVMNLYIISNHIYTEGLKLLDLLGEERGNNYLGRIVPKENRVKVVVDGRYRILVDIDGICRLLGNVRNNDKSLKFKKWLSKTLTNEKNFLVSAYIIEKYKKVHNEFSNECTAFMYYRGSHNIGGEFIRKIANNEEDFNHFRNELVYKIDSKSGCDKELRRIIRENEEYYFDPDEIRIIEKVTDIESYISSFIKWVIENRVPDKKSEDFIYQMIDKYFE